MTDALGPRGGRPVLPRIGQDEDDPGEPEVVVAPDPEMLAALAADYVVVALVGAVAERGRADIALTGGSTPRTMYRRLVEPGRRDQVDWERVHVWWGDDRFVARVHPHSNVGPADTVLLAPGGIPIPPGNIHPFPIDRALAGGLGAGWCAATYADEVAAALALVDGWPSFDLLVVGVGEDGHLLSVFPGSPALSSDRIGLAVPAPGHIDPRVDRVTLNPAVVTAARAALVTATGVGKAEVIGRILEGPRDPSALPGVLARRSGATWILDEAAAGRLVGAIAIALRRAVPDDARAVADIWLAAFDATYAFAAAHTADEVRSWVRSTLLVETETWLAEDHDGTVVGFVSLGDAMLDQLYIRPGRTGQGIGARLVGLAKSQRPAGLDLYTFQVNVGARRFYERHGFVAVAFGDGNGNDERQPDVLYRWAPGT